MSTMPTATESAVEATEELYNVSRTTLADKKKAAREMLQSMDKAAVSGGGRLMPYLLTGLAHLAGSSVTFTHKINPVVLARDTLVHGVAPSKGDRRRSCRLRTAAQGSATPDAAGQAARAVAPTQHVRPRREGRIKAQGMHPTHTAWLP